MVVYLARERDVYFVAVEASYADSAVSLMYRTYTCSYTCKHIMRSTRTSILMSWEYEIKYPSFKVCEQLCFVFESNQIITTLHNIYKATRYFYSRNFIVVEQMK